jgi:hemolysin III
MGTPSLRQPKPFSTQSFAEEIANAVTHGVGAALSIAGLTLLVVMAAWFSDGWMIVGVSVYGFALVFLYLASTLYHSMPRDPAKSFFLVLDHVGIALLIAGTYTPILLGKMRTPTGLAFLGVIWGLAITSACIKAFFTQRYTVLSAGVYVAMGWLAIFLARGLFEALGLAGVAWMAVGGLSYSLGVIPFLWERLPYNHAVWHLFVLGGSACHYVAIMRYVVLG